MIEDQDIIDDVMDNFDFNKVADTMEFLKWEWHDVGIPDVRDLKKCVRGLCREVLQKLDTNKEMYVGTGGFMVRGRVFDNKKYIEVSFDVATWSNYE